MIPVHSNPVFVVDWDGTCTEAMWPEQGDWLPGAIEALKALLYDGDVIIFSCRTSPYMPYTDESRDPKWVFEDICRMRQMLDDAGLEDAKIHLRKGKPTGDVYIDDRAFTHTGWEDTLARLGFSST